MRRTTLGLLLATALALLGAAGEARADTVAVQAVKAETVTALREQRIPVVRARSPRAIEGRGVTAFRRAGGGAATALAASNTTTQLISQIQVSGCLAHCEGVVQSQSAKQQNTTVQVVTHTAGGGVRIKPPSDPANRSMGGSRTIHIQIGCVSRCVHSTPSSGPVPGAVLRAVGQLVNQPVSDAMHRLLSALRIPGLASLAAVSAAERNVVLQSASQVQTGAALNQTQNAQQSNTSVQVDGAFSSPTLRPQSTPQSALVGVANRTEQGILQLQIGCLMFCAHTHQYQAAAQTNTAVRAIANTASSSGPTDPSAGLNSTGQLIYQLQIGCVFSCNDATELQSAVSDASGAVRLIGAPTGHASSPSTRPAPVVPAALAPSPPISTSARRANVAARRADVTARPSPAWSASATVFTTLSEPTRPSRASAGVEIRPRRGVALSGLRSRHVAHSQTARLSRSALRSGRGIAVDPAAVAFLAVLAFGALVVRGRKRTH